MSDLAAFLRARLDEDEAAANAAALAERNDRDWYARSTPHDVRPGETERWYVEDGLEEAVAYRVDAQGGDARGMAEHIARHDPARVLADVAAKRAILAGHAQTEGMGYYPDDPGPRGSGYGDMSSVCTTCGTADEYGTPWPCATLRHLAAVYADHPDYDPAWRP